ncbi:sialate O-acetylesterase [Pontibacter roseus]|uniref:sialate O-acetylesterase n=1 Tax=Pontibacter roseus TaxID=336989 RepID=UPI000475859A|nr:sialate O-acetylesterase [Pontibacter roseus]
MTSCEQSDDTIEPELEKTEEAVDVHVIMGQSNAQGFGSNATELPADVQGPIKGAYIFNAAKGQFEPLQAGVNTQAAEGEFGLVVKAAQLLQQHKKQDVYFIVTAQSGTQLYKSGTSDVQDWHPESGELLAQSKRTIDRARMALIASGKTPVVKSIAWWQGEKDATEEAMASAYQQNEQALFESLDQVEYLKNTKRVVYKIFSDIPEMPFASGVNAAKARRAAADPRTIKVIETDGYERIPEDRIHANAAGQVQAGTDLFNAIKEL